METENRMTNAPKHKRMTRSERIVVRFTEKELERVRGNAASAGIRWISAYMRLMAIHGKIEVKKEASVPIALISELRAAGNNLNQVVRRFHIHGELPPEWIEVCEQLGAIFERISGMM